MTSVSLKIKPRCRDLLLPSFSSFPFFYLYDVMNMEIFVKDFTGFILIWYNIRYDELYFVLNNQPMFKPLCILSVSSESGMASDGYRWGYVNFVHFLLNYQQLHVL